MSFVSVGTLFVSCKSWGYNSVSEPLPVQDLHASMDEKTGFVKLDWHPDNSSLQESYKVSKLIESLHASVIYLYAVYLMMLWATEWLADNE